MFWLDETGSFEGEKHNNSAGAGFHRAEFEAISMTSQVSHSLGGESGRPMAIPLDATSLWASWPQRVDKARKVHETLGSPQMPRGVLLASMKSSLRSLQRAWPDTRKAPP